MKDGLPSVLIPSALVVLAVLSIVNTIQIRNLYQAAKSAVAFPMDLQIAGLEVQPKTIYFTDAEVRIFYTVRNNSDVALTKPFTIGLTLNQGPSAGKWHKDFFHKSIGVSIIGGVTATKEHKNCFPPGVRFAPFKKYGICQQVWRVAGLPPGDYEALVWADPPPLIYAGDTWRPNNFDRVKFKIRNSYPPGTNPILKPSPNRVPFKWPDPPEPKPINCFEECQDFDFPQECAGRGPGTKFYTRFMAKKGNYCHFDLARPGVHLLATAALTREE